MVIDATAKSARCTYFMEALEIKQNEKYLFKHSLERGWLDK